MSTSPEVILASASPRRAAILGAAGVDFAAVPPSIDDADLADRPGDPSGFTMSLAWLKARDVVRSGRIPAGARWLVAADTLCVRDGAHVGKPADAESARAMIRAFRGRSHDVVTGICVVELASGRRRMVADRARVTLGELGEDAIERHVSSGAWRGKAGGYNFADCVAAGWPLRCEGDPETVVGLPLRLVLPLLREGRAA